ncbi:FMRFamide receptor [Plakobranchus ocellatus]|uniref:FMRFamide receptor n=1 Tax=Plakobranchus ocellatus TaxID=259542 RepID=A0AAV3Y3M8_9GAST|nr:FMRFamide receptor [Plakobranchus ocellatus]
MTFFPSLAFAPGYCSVMVFLAYVCSFLSAWFVVLMMAERYIAVCHPFRASALCNKRKSVMVIAGLSAFSVVLYSHSFFTTIESRPCSIDAGSYGFLIVFTYLDSFLVLVVPFVAIVLLNLKVIFTVRGFRRQHNLLNNSLNGYSVGSGGTSSGSNNNGSTTSTTTTLRFHTSSKTLSLAQVRSTKMLVWVSSVFLVLYLPSYAARLYGLILQQATGGFKTEQQRLHFQIAQQLCQFLYFLNFAIDFLVYLVTSNNFRRNIRRFIKNMRVIGKRSSMRRRPPVRGRN